MTTPPRRIGPWVLGPPLGAGTTATVFSARRRSTGPWRALKRLIPAPAPGSAADLRLKREVSLCRSLRHPGLVRLIDCVRDGDEVALVSQLAAGTSLEAMVTASGGLAPFRVHGLAIGMARALAYLHDHGLVHRDVKSSNVVVGPRDQLKLVDYGLVRSVEQTTLVTRQGQRKASLAYAAPELLLGQEVGPAADLYALGIVIFEILTGSRPFEESSPATLVAAHLQQAPPVPSTRAKGLSPWWDRITTRLLAKSPQDRYASAAALADDLAELSIELTAG